MKPFFSATGRAGQDRSKFSAFISYRLIHFILSEAQKADKEKEAKAKAEAEAASREAAAKVAAAKLEVWKRRFQVLCEY